MRLPDEKMARRYLLGQLTEAEQARVEEAFFADEEIFEGMLAAEDDLIDDYASGQLSPAERRAFEPRFLTSDRQRQRILFSRMLIVHSINAPKPAAPTARIEGWARLAHFFRGALNPLALAAAAVLAAVFVGWFFISRPDPAVPIASQPAPSVQAPGEARDENRDEDRDTVAATEEVSPPAPKSEEKPAPAARPRPALVFTLISGATRAAGQAQRLSIPAGAERVRLRVEVEDESLLYNAVLRTVEGRTVWRQTGLRARRTAGGGVLTLTLAANLLARDDYILTISTATPGGPAEEVGEFYFRVAK